MERRSPWSKAETVAGFAQSPPNDTLIAFATAERVRLAARGLAIDIGCGAGRNAIPLVVDGWNVLGLDLSLPMLTSAAARRDESLAGHLHLAFAAMHALPVRNACADLVIAHGIWNLARSAVEFRLAVAEAARLSKSGAALFIFTFSRHTLPTDARPVSGESFVFTDFSGEPQCFLTDEQLIAELGAHGYSLDPALPLREHNLPKRGMLATAGVPVIYEAVFRYH